MAKVLSPFVYWAQSEQNLFIKIDLKDVKCPEVKLEKRTLKFEGKGVGAQGNQNYGFSIDFYSEIDTEESTCKVQDSKIDFNIAKVEKSWWPRLTSKPQKPAWLKIDFDRWQSEEDANSDTEKVRDVREDYADLYNRLQKEEIGYMKENIRKVYLILYNLLMFVGFMYVVSVLGIQFLRDGFGCFANVYDSVGFAVKYLHILQMSEVVLTLLGLKSGDAITGFVQTGGRIFIVMCLIDPEPRLQVQPAVFVLFMVWSSIEIIRYPYYMLQVCKIDIPLLTWIRYSVWIFLYPLGFSAEGTVMYKSIPYTEETGRFSITLPNTFNISFSLVSILRVYLLIFIFPTLIFLMSHMYRARMKKYGANSWKKVK